MCAIVISVLCMHENISYNRILVQTNAQRVLVCSCGCLYKKFTDQSHALTVKCIYFGLSHNRAERSQGILVGGK